MRTKYYIELTNSSFLVSARNAEQAIALFWKRQLFKAKRFKPKQLKYFRWSLLEIELSYKVHLGQRSEARWVCASGSIRFLTQREMRLLMRSIIETHGFEVLESFSNTICIGIEDK